MQVQTTADCHSDKNPNSTVGYIYIYTRVCVCVCVCVCVEHHHTQRKEVHKKSPFIFQLYYVDSIILNTSVMTTFY